MENRMKKGKQGRRWLSVFLIITMLLSMTGNTIFAMNDGVGDKEDAGQKEIKSWTWPEDSGLSGDGVYGWTLALNASKENPVKKEDLETLLPGFITAKVTDISGSVEIKERVEQPVSKSPVKGTSSNAAENAESKASGSDADESAETAKTAKTIKTASLAGVSDVHSPADSGTSDERVKLEWDLSEVAFPLYEGSLSLTAKLPDKYRMADGAQNPGITVVFGNAAVMLSGEDENGIQEGIPYAIVHHVTQSDGTNAAILAEGKKDGATDVLKGESVTLVTRTGGKRYVRVQTEEKKKELLVWHFEKAGNEEGEKYYVYAKNAGSGGGSETEEDTRKYLKISQIGSSDSAAITLVTEKTEASVISAGRGGENYEGTLRLTNNNGHAVNLYGGNVARGFGGWRASQGVIDSNDWFYLVPEVKSVENPGKAEGTTPSGTVINLFDYWTTPQRMYTEGGGDYGYSYNQADLERGINENHALKFTRYGKAWANDDGQNFNRWTGTKTVYSGIVQDRLINGYPALNEETTKSDESLAYLFDPNDESGSENREVFRRVSGLLQQDEDGYYYYNSRENYAELDERSNKITLYDDYGVISDGASRIRGEFFPFNRYADVKELTCTDEEINHYFGMTLSTRFIQRYGGHITSRQDSKPTAFEFSGDDDVWIFIDDILVADLGGIHDAADVRIDFSDGSVTVNESEETLKDIFNRHGLAEDETEWNGNTFADNTCHTLRFFYLERGNTDSNLSLKYNLTEVPDNTIYKVDQNGNPVEGAVFAIYAANEDWEYLISDGEENGSVSLEGADYSVDPKTGCITVMGTGDTGGAGTGAGETDGGTDAGNMSGAGTDAGDADGGTDSGNMGGAGTGAGDADTDDAGASIIITPQYVGRTDSEGKMLFMDDDEEAYSIADLKRVFGSHFILREISVPEGYRPVSEETCLYIENNVMLCANTYESGVWASPKLLVSATDLLYKSNPADGSDPIEYCNPEQDPAIYGTLFAVVLKYNGPVDGNQEASLEDLAEETNWSPIYGDDEEGYTVVRAEDDGEARPLVRAAIKAAQESQRAGSQVVFTDALNGAMELEMINLPGDVKTYYYMLGEDEKAKAKYTIGYYWTEADKLEEATADNTYNIDANAKEEYTGFARAFGSIIKVPDLVNRLLVQKMSPDGALVNGAYFALYPVVEEGGKVWYIGDSNKHIALSTTDANATVKNADGTESTGIYTVCGSSSGGNGENSGSVGDVGNSGNSENVGGVGNSGNSENIGGVGNSGNSENIGGVGNSGNSENIGGGENSGSSENGGSVGNIGNDENNGNTEGMGIPRGTIIIRSEEGPEIARISPGENAKGDSLVETTLPYPRGLSGRRAVSDEAGTCLFTNLKDGTYYLREVTAPKGYDLNTTEVSVLVDGGAVYANAGTKDDGVTVARGPGYIVSSMQQFASAGDLDNTLTWIYTKLRVKETTGAGFAEPVHHGSWEFARSVEKDADGNERTVDMRTNLVYSPTGAGALFNYAAMNEEGKPEEGEEKTHQRRLYTDVGWSYLDIYQNYEYGSKHVADGVNYEDWSADTLGADGELSNLFSGSVYIQITDTPTGGVVSIPVTKAWDDGGNKDGRRPDSITVKLEAKVDGTVKDTRVKVLTASDSNAQNASNWEYVFENLRKKDEDGNEIQYTVSELPVNGYTTSISKTQDNGYVITNTPTSDIQPEKETVSVTIRKIWKDNNNKDGKRPDSITIRLSADGKEIQVKVLTASDSNAGMKDNWLFTFENLPKCSESGKEISYSVTEDPVEGYTAQVNGYTVTNTRKSDEPDDPEEPTKPTEPEDPTKPAGPEAPTKPTEPEDPTKPAEPEDPTKPTEPEDPTKPTEPEDPTKPAEPEDPTKPAGPEDPTNPTDPTGPTTPTAPAIPTPPDSSNSTKPWREPDKSSSDKPHTVRDESLPVDVIEVSVLRNGPEHTPSDNPKESKDNTPNADTPSASPNTSVPRTGDGSQMGFWCSILMLSMIGLGVMLVIRRRKE